ncbi:asialoglycoprotein receptor 1-like [Carcharodon carcharias]|uniref:asialoglycoprotein receptor 1-like n=1 Tax=Carcharodon carcharias TaxID=13397 RepID=UPI001B7DC0AC|nr:asialoglycoprotein receptor 1-like [Carcharodon carcharias]
MAGEHAYDDFENFNLDNEQKQQRTKWIPGSRFKSVFSGMGLLLLIFILLCVILILLITGVIKCSETNETVEEFQSQVQMQVSHALNNVSDKSELKELELRIRNEVTQLGERVLAELTKNTVNLINSVTSKLEMLPEPACQNLQCPRHWIHFNDSCYYYSTEKASWNSSSLYCSLRGAHLLVVNSVYEQHFATLETQSKRFWIGLSDHIGKNKWQWVDGTDYNTTPKFWMPGEPNSHLEGCAHLWMDGLWNDAPCTVEDYFICEIEAQH